MVSGPGIERNEGMLGFDWVTHRGDPQPANADMNFTGLLPPDINDLRDRFDLTEGLSGWMFNDILRGDSGDALTMVGHELNAAGIARINGLAALTGATSFTGGNIILGGAGSDLIEGRGGNDIIDGDRWLNVQLLAPVIGLVDSMTQLWTAVFAGTLNPGSISIVRSIVVPAPVAADCGAASALNCDTAVFSGARAEYTLTQDVTNPTVWTVAHLGGGGIDGTDTLHNMERAQFTDQVVSLASTLENSPATAAINNPTPTEDQLLTASVVDANGTTTSTIAWTWEALVGVAWTPVGAGATFIPRDAQVGQPLRVLASFLDDGGFAESVISAPTAPVANINDVPTGVPTLNAEAALPQENEPVTASASGIADADGLAGVTFNFQWQQSALGGGAPFANITGAVLPTFTPLQAQVNRALRVSVSYTDNQGTLDTVVSAATGVVGDVFVGTPADDLFTGTAGRDNASGLAGADTLNTGGGADVANGGGGADTINTAGGNDIVIGNGGNDAINTGADNDSIRVGLNDGFDAVNGGTGVDEIRALQADTVIGLVSLAGIETITGGAFAGVTIAGSDAANVLNFSAVTLTNIGQINGGLGDDTITGSAAADVLLGGGGGDTVNGGPGDDTVTGGAGDDTMNGGAGLDTFRFAAGFGADRILGFDANPTGGQDLLDLRPLGITAATFASVVITTAGGGADTLITIGASSVRLVGVARAAISITDFILTP
jgi:Ca2+-binding RTX toxin-like protein